MGEGPCLAERTDEQTRANLVSVGEIRQVRTPRSESRRYSARTLSTFLLWTCGEVAGAEGRAQGGLGVDWTRREGAAWREGSALVQRRAIHRWPEQFPSLLSSLRADAVQECLLLLLLLLCPR